MYKNQLLKRDLSLDEADLQHGTKIYVLVDDILPSRSNAYSSPPHNPN